MLTSVTQKVTEMTKIMFCNRYKSWIFTRFTDAFPHCSKLVLFKAMWYAKNKGPLALVIL